MDAKQCRACGEWKLPTEFYTKRSNRDGLHPYCKECDKAAARRWQLQNKERASAYRKHWEKQNKDRVRRNAHNFRVTHRDALRVRNQQWSAQHREVLRERNRAWRLSNPAKHVAKQHRRRVRKRNNGGSYTTAEWQALCEQYGHRCLACGASVPLTVDHIVPISKGGSNDISNIQPLCMPCNLKKGVRAIDYR